MNWEKLMYLWILLQTILCKNKYTKFEAHIIENNTSISDNNPEINQRNFVIHTVEDYQKS